VFRTLVDLYLPRAHSAEELAGKLLPYFPAHKVEIDLEDKTFKDREKAKAILNNCRWALGAGEDNPDANWWTPENILQALESVAEAQEVSLGRVAGPVRAALLGVNQGPGIDQTVYLMGRDLALSRILQAEERLRS